MLGNCIKKRKTSFIMVNFWAICAKCRHRFIASEMIGCVHGRSDECPKCHSSKYNYDMHLTKQEKDKLDADIKNNIDFLYRGRVNKKKQDY